MLKIIKALDPDKSNIVHWFEHFVHRDQTCLVFEMLDISLFDYWNSTLQPEPFGVSLLNRGCDV